MSKPGQAESNLNHNKAINYKNQAEGYIKDILDTAKIKSEDIIGSFRTLTTSYVLRTVLNKEKPIDILLTNPVLGYEKILSNLEAESFFKQLLDANIFPSAVWNLVSSKNFISKVSEGIIREVVKELIERKDISKLKLVFSSEHIIAKIDNKFIQKFISDVKSQDPVIVSKVISFDGFQEKFNTFLRSKKGEELYKYFNEVSEGLVQPTLKLTVEDGSFKQNVLEAFVKKISPNASFDEIYSKNGSYVKLLLGVPELFKRLELKVPELKAKLASEGSKEIMNFFKNLNGECVKLVFKTSGSSQDKKIIENLSITLNDGSMPRANLESWYKFTSNSVIEFLMQKQVIQAPFIKFINEEREKQFLSKALVMNGNVALFKILASQEALRGSIELPGTLITTAVNKKQAEMLEFLSQDDYFAGRLFEEDTPEKSQFLEQFASAFETARVFKNYKLLKILVEQFPQDYVPSSPEDKPTLMEAKLANLFCQFKDHPSLKFNPDNKKGGDDKEAAKEDEALFVPKRSPDHCIGAPTLEDLANGAELERVNINDVTSTLKQQFTYYETLLSSEAQPESVASSNDKNSSQGNTAVNTKVVYIKATDKESNKSFFSSIMKAVPYVIAAGAELSLMKNHGISTDFCRLTYPKCAVQKHGDAHDHVAAFKKAASMFTSFQIAKATIDGLDAVSKLLPLTKGLDIAIDAISVTVPILIDGLIFTGQLGDGSSQAKLSATVSTFVSVGALGASYALGKFSDSSETMYDVKVNNLDNNPLHTQPEHNENVHNEL